MVANAKHLMTTAHLKAIPYDEWHRFELIEGKLYVSCTTGISHQLVLGNLQFQLGNYLHENPIGTLVPGSGVVFNEYNSVIPDITYVSRERWETIATKDYFNAAPDLLIEILSSGESYSRDLKLKRTIYGKYGVPEYWIVDGWSRSIMIFRLDEGRLKKVTTFRENDALESPLVPGLSLKLSAIFTDDVNELFT